MTGLQQNSNNFNGAAMPVVMGIKSSNSSGVSITCLGKLPVVFAPAIRRESKTEVWRHQSERRRFTVEQLCAELERQLDSKIKILSDKRGIFAGNRVRICAAGFEMSISCLPVEFEAETGSVVSTDYYVWEISVDGGSILRPRAGKGRFDVDRCSRMLRCEIIGY